MLKNALSAALVLAIVGTGALVAPPVAASAAPVVASESIAPADATADDHDHEGVDYDHDMLALPDIAVVRKRAARAQALQTAEAGTPGNPETHPLYFSVVSTTATASDDDVPNLDEASVRALVDRLHDYWFAESGGTINFTFGGYETRQLGAATCNPDVVFTDVQQVAFDGSFADFAFIGTKKHLTVLSSEGVACAGRGFGYLVGETYGGGGAIFSANGTSTSYGTTVMAHELGHNLGFRHASASICRSETNFDSTIDQFGLGANRVELSNTTVQCPTEDYGDFVDIMGYGVENAVPHLSTPQKVASGYLTDYATVTPENSGTFPLSSVDNSAQSGTNRSLKITDPTTGQVYFVEYRTKTGADTTSYLWRSADAQSHDSVDGYKYIPFLGNPTTGEVRILRPLPAEGFVGTTVLAVAPVGGVAKSRRPGLPAGSTFTNDKGIFSVTVNSAASGTGASISVAFTVPTTTTLSLSQSGTQKYGATPTVVATGKVAKVGTVFPAGTMKITADGTTVGTGSVNSSGEYSISLPSSLSIGSHAIKSIFTPSLSSYVASSSAESTLTVTAAPTVTTLTLDNSGAQVYSRTPRVTATASVGLVDGAYPAGQIQFRDGSEVVATVTTNSSGTASYPFPLTTSAGSHQITARFVPDSALVESSTSTAKTLVVTAVPSSVALTLDRSTQGYGTSSPAVAEASVAELAEGGFAAGAVEFRDGATLVGTVPVNATGIARYTVVPTLSVGSHSLVARFVPTSGNIAPSTSATKTLTVTAASTTTTLTLDRSAEQTFGSTQRVTATASVVDVNGTTPQGTVEFRDGTTVLGTVPTTSGTASYVFSASLAAGSHTITAVFTAASSSYANSSSPAVTLTVRAATTSTSLSLDRQATQVYLGSPTVTATASVDQVAGSYPAGQVEFREGSSVLATVTTSATGVATYSFPAAFAFGAHDITARFVPSSTSYLPSTSAAATLAVTASPTSTTLALSGSQVFASGSPATATATVAAVSGVYPQGSVEFLDGTTVLDTKTVSATGVATLAFPGTLAAGTHSITARFVPSASSFSGSTTAPRTLTVSAAPTSTTISLDRGGSQVYGSADTVTTTATVAAVAGTVPAGDVVFLDGTTTVATVTVNASGAASWTAPSTFALGSHTIKARFEPVSANYAISTSAGSALGVTASATTTSLSISNSGSQVFLGASPAVATASVSQVAGGGYAPGNISFRRNGTELAYVAVSATGTASYTFSNTLAVGSYSITATFTPSTSAASSSASTATAFVVTKAPTETALSFDNSATQSYSLSPRVTATATVTATGRIGYASGSVTFYDGSTVLASGVAVSGSTSTATYVFPASTAVGTHSISAVFVSTDSSFTGSTSAAGTMTVTPAPTTTTLLSTDLQQRYLTSSATATAQVDLVGGVYPSGQVEFRDGTTLVATVTVNTANGRAAYEFPNTTAVGAHSITAKFVPAANTHSASTSPVGTLTVSPAQTTTTLSLNGVNGQTYGSGTTGTATATVSQVDGSYPAGMMQFLDGTTVLATSPIESNGSAPYTFAGDLPAGAHSITSRFVPLSTSITGSTSAARTFTVSPGTAAVALTLDRQAQAYGTATSAVANATVARVNGSFPAGNIVFRDGTTPLATVAVSSSGTAETTLSAFLASGSHTITARFEPQGSSLVASVSTSSSLTVSKFESTVTLTLDNSSTQVYDSSTRVTATARVSAFGAGGYPAGNIQFRDGGSTVATVETTASGIASYTFSSTVAAGSHTITAVFLPASDSVTGVTSASRPLTVTKAPTSLGLSLDATTSTYRSGSPVTATASVTAINGVFPTGIIVFSDGQTEIDLQQVDATGTATTTLPTTTPAGSHVITAVFTPDNTSYAGSTSPSRTLAVAQAATTAVLSLDRATQAYLGSGTTQATGRVTLFNGTFPDGVIQFRDGSSVLATVPTGPDGYAYYDLEADLAVGAHSLTARFVPGDSSYSTSTSAPSAFSVTAAATSTSLELSDPATQPLGSGSGVTATATVAAVRGVVPAGQVEFREGQVVLATVAADASGTAAFTFPPATSVGDHSVVARFVPATASFTTSTSAARVVTVTRGQTVTSITLSRDLQSYGSSTTSVLTARVGRIAGVYPAGSFVFLDGDTELATVAASAGSASYTSLPTLSIGAHAISARFVPTLDSTYLGSTSDSATLTVASSSSRTVLQLDYDGVQVIGDENTVTATASVDNYAGGTHAGTVTFFDGSTSVATVEVDENGNASYRFPSGYALGTHSITAKFVAVAADVAGSTSAAQTLTVRAVGTTTELSLDYGSTVGYSSNYPLRVGVVVSRDDFGAPAGTLAFLSDGVQIGSISFTPGVQEYSLPRTLAAGTHQITAVFTPGSTAVAASTSNAVSVTVAPNETTTRLSFDPSYQYFGSATRAAAVIRVSTLDGALPTGRVELAEGSTVLGTVDLAADPDADAFTPTGLARFTLPSSLGVGTHSITARYISTNPSVLPSSASGTVYVYEAPAATGLAIALALDHAASQVFGASSTATATATVTVTSGSVPAGSVSFRDGSTVLGTVPVNASGVVSLALPNDLASGSHSITARFDASGSTVSTVTSPAATLSVSDASPTITLAIDRGATQVYGAAQSATLTATLSPIAGLTPAGSVFLVVDGGQTGLQAQLVNGSASFVLSNTLSVGTHAISVVYSSQSPSVRSAPSSATPLTVTGAASTTSLSLDRSGMQSFEDPRTVTATAVVAKVGTEQPSGAVRFRDGDAVVATVRLSDTGTASYAFPASFSLGSHSITAVFVPDAGSNFAGSTSAARILTVTQPTITTTGIVLSAASQVYGTTSPATITATVTAGTLSPAGSIDFFVDGYPVRSMSVNGAPSVVSLDGRLEAGSHTITARFTAASTEYAVSESSESFVVEQLSVPVALATSKTSQTYGSTSRATLTATIDAGVLASAGGGKVTFRNGSTTLSTVAVAVGGVTTVTLAATTKVGTQPYTATFTPTDAANVTGTTSAIATVKVTQAKSTTSLALKSSSVKVKKTSTATVTVKVSGVTAPTGTITLYSGTKKLKAYTLSASKKGKLSITVPAFSKKATAKLKVVYSGTTDIIKSTSSTKSLKVK